MCVCGHAKNAYANAEVRRAGFGCGNHPQGSDGGRELPSWETSTSEVEDTTSVSVAASID